MKVNPFFFYLCLRKTKCLRKTEPWVVTAAISGRPVSNITLTHRYTGHCLPPRLPVCRTPLQHISPSLTAPVRPSPRP